MEVNFNDVINKLAEVIKQQAVNLGIKDVQIEMLQKQLAELNGKEAK